MTNNPPKPTLASLLAGIVFVDPIYDRDIDSITSDSRTVANNALFVAYSGAEVDARAFIIDAIAKGAVAILTESEADTPDDVEMINQIPVFKTPNARDQIAKIAARFYGHPTRQMSITGITGTNGKTSISHFIANAKRALGVPCAIVGTVGYGLPGALSPLSHTTPDPIFLQQHMHDWLAAGIQDVAMEVSSHALSQARVKHIEFTTAIFTNLTRDHLDYHGDMARYGLAKQRLFETFGLNYAVLNADDPFSLQLRSVCEGRVKVITYGVQEKADCTASNIRYLPKGLAFDCHTPWGDAEVEVPIFGRFNVSNILAVIASLLCEGHAFSKVISACSTLTGVAGRMQLLRFASLPTVVVDYAHTPDALSKALEATRLHTQGKIWCVFGCGGDRDPGKRPLMAAAAANAADCVIVTDDNPRTENSERIFSEILAGFSEHRPVLIEHDRRRAIEYALKNADKNDVVVIAGKGHENYQILGKERIHFSDCEVVDDYHLASVSN